MRQTEKREHKRKKFKLFLVEFNCAKIATVNTRLLRNAALLDVIFTSNLAHQTYLFVLLQQLFPSSSTPNTRFLISFYTAILCTIFRVEFLMDIGNFGEQCIDSMNNAEMDLRNTLSWSCELNITGSRQRPTRTSWLQWRTHRYNYCGLTRELVQNQI